MHNRVVAFNAILVLLVIEWGSKDFVGFPMVGGNYLFVTTASSDGGVSIVVCVNL